MQSYAVVLVAMTAVCATVGFYELLTWTRLRGHGSDVAFGLICVAAALFDAGCAGEYNVLFAYQSVPWLRIQSIGLCLTGLTFAWYLSGRTGRISRRQMIILAVWYALGVLVQVVGFGDLTWVPSNPQITQVNLPFGFSVVYREADSGLITNILYLTGMLLFGYYLWVVIAYARSGHRREARPLFVLIGVMGAAYLNDVAVAQGWYASLYCVEYAWLAVVVFVGLQRARQLIEASTVKQDLAESEEKFRLFIEQSSEAILISDEQGRVVECNAAAERLTGQERERILGAPIWQVGVRVAVQSPAAGRCSRRRGAWGRGEGGPDRG